MAAQNLVSANLSAEAKERVLAHLEGIRKELDFLAAFGEKELRGLFRAGTGFAPLLDKAYLVAGEHPEILPSIFPSEEFKRDYRLYKELAPIASQVEQLARSLEGTMTALSSDTLMEALEVYAAVKQHRDKVPGLGVVAADMGVFFAKARKRDAAAKD